MNIKAVVKVMNFHALLRVESSRAVAEKYGNVSDEIETMMKIIYQNKNLRVDRKFKLPDPNLPALKIYLGSDLGFCGNVNATVSQSVDKDSTSEKIVVGKRVRKGKDVGLSLSLEELQKDFSGVRKYLKEAIKERKWSAIYLVYNHFYNLSSIKPVERKIYPLDNENEEELHDYSDFSIEGDVTELIEDMIILYLTYEVKIAMASAYASENIMRQNATTESLKKLDEMETEETKRVRKEKTQKSFQKTIDSFVKQKSLKEEN